MVSGCDGRGGSSGTQVDDREVVSHFTGIISTVACIPQPQLAQIILPPALDGAVVQHEAAVRRTSSYWNCGSRLKPIRLRILTGMIANTVFCISRNTYLVGL